MEIKIAKNAGFCFGVKRAMQMASDELDDKSTKVYSLGPLIHNKQAVSKYEEKGLNVVEEISEIPTDERVIIRSHGVGESIYNEAHSKSIKIVDTTCPFVKKIHKIVNDFYKKGYKIIIIGNKNHPEVIGINGWCDNSAVIIKTTDEIDKIYFDQNQKYCVVSQTTVDVDDYEKITSKLSSVLKDATIKNTICSATKERQLSAKSLAKEVDCMIVIGGKHSSNTQKLVNICKEVTDTFAIETKDELNKEELKKYNLIGITAGASTPDWIISDVIDFLESI
ncbi:MAG: 4-hydroxy-3-methylbut-2-enyl diphosphate reductase [Intestinibacter sp.]